MKLLFYTIVSVEDNCKDGVTLIKEMEQLNLCAYKRQFTQDLFICYGYNLSFPLAKREIESVGGNWQKIIAQEECLYKQQCESIFDATLRRSEQLTTYSFGNRVCTCEYAILVDIVYSVGPEVSTLSKLIVDVEYDQWSSAAEYISGLIWCKYNQERCVRDSLLLIKGCNQTYIPL